MRVQPRAARPIGYRRWAARGSSGPARPGRPPPSRAPGRRAAPPPPAPARPTACMSRRGSRSRRRRRARSSASTASRRRGVSQRVVPTRTAAREHRGGGPAGARPRRSSGDHRDAVRRARGQPLEHRRTARRGWPRADRSRPARSPRDQQLDPLRLGAGAVGQQPQRGGVPARRQARGHAARSAGPAAVRTASASASPGPAERSTWGARRRGAGAALGQRGCATPHVRARPPAASG